MRLGEGPNRSFTMIFVHTWRSFNQTFEARAPEWVLTGAMISLSLVFFLNDTVFYQETFEGLRNILNSRYSWGLILGMIGLSRLSVLVINGSYWRTPHLRSFTAFLSAGIWFLFCVGFARNSSVLVAILPWVFLLDALNAKRAGHEAGKSEFIQRYLRQEQVNAGMARGPQR